MSGAVNLRFYILLDSVINRDVYIFYIYRRSSLCAECGRVAGGSRPHPVREHLHGQRLRRHALHGKRGVYKNAFQEDAYRPLQWTPDGGGCLPGWCKPRGLCAWGVYTPCGQNS